MDESVYKVTKCFLVVLICHYICAAAGQSPNAPPPVENLSYNVSYGRQTVSILLLWTHPMMDPDIEYTITGVSNTSGFPLSFTTNTTQLPLPPLFYNTGYNISVEATNSSGSSTPTILEFFEFGCGTPPSPDNGAVLYESAQGGVMAIVACFVDGSLVPRRPTFCTMQGWLPFPQTQNCPKNEEFEVSLVAILVGSIIACIVLLVLQAVWLIFWLRHDVKKQTDIYKF